MDICLILRLLHTCCFLLHARGGTRGQSVPRSIRLGQRSRCRAGGAGRFPSPEGGCSTLCPQHSTSITRAVAGCPGATVAPLDWGPGQATLLKISWSSKPKQLSWNRCQAAGKLELHGQGRFISKLFGWAFTQRSCCRMFNTADVAMLF